MRRLIAVCLLAAFASFSLDASAAVTINWAPVGNPGNSADNRVMQDGTTGYGSVAYNYRIDKYDVTNSQYVEFLNTKDPIGLNPLGLYNSHMSTDGGINFNNLNLPGSKYSTISGRQSHPVNFVTWYDTLRFANWLNNGQGIAGDTETGAYTLLGGTPTPSNGNSITRNVGAAVFLPSENEWYKAAYYNPGNSSYFQFATSSNGTPIASGPTGLANHANYHIAVDKLTDVGAYTGTTSPYGAFDMNGNVYQWNEALIPFGSSRGLRGGYYDSSSIELLSSNRGSYQSPSSLSSIIGFRVAMIPEPSSLALAAFGFVGLAAWGWRRRKR